MNKKLNNRGLKVVLSIIVSIIIIITIILLMIFSNSSYKPSVTKMSYTLIDKVKQAVTKGDTLELNQEEINELADVYFKETKKIKSIEVKGVDIVIQNSNIEFYIPINYKGFQLLLSSQGELSYKENQINYKLLFFKIGKVNLPKNFVLEKLKQNMKTGIVVKDGYISIDKGFIPLGIKSLEVKNNKIQIGLEKAAINLEEKIKSISNAFSNKDNTLKAKTEDVVKNEGNEGTKENSQEKAANYNNTEKIILDNKNSPERNKALDRVNSGLDAAMGSVSTGNQKVVIGQVISVVNTMKGNPGYNPYTASSSVKGAYKNLSTEEKQQLKAAIISNVDMEAVNLLINMLGN